MIRTADQSSPPGAAATPPKRPVWQRLYFLLAVFNVLTVSLALLLSDRLMGIYTDSVELNTEWVARGNAYARLGALAAKVNAPGNDIFDSHDVDLESARLARASREFDAYMTGLRREIRTENTILQGMFNRRLDEVAGAMASMTAEAATIFQEFSDGDADAAGSRMAAMDRTYNRLNGRIEALRLDVKAVQRELFVQQVAQAQKLRVAEVLLAAMILLMVVAAAWYGRRVARATERQSDERERYMAELQHTQQQLAHARDALEERVRQRTAQLQDSELRTRSIVANSHDAFVALDAAGVVTDWNAQAEATFGWTAQEAIGQPLHALIIPERMRQQHVEGLERFNQVGTGDVINKLVQMPALHRDGHEFPVELTISPLRIGGVSIFTAFLRDITERKRAEAELDRFFSLSLDMLCIASYDGYFRRLNPAWEATLGYTQEELMARPFLDFVHPDDREATLAAAAQLADGQEVRAFKNRYRCKDGSTKWLLWHAAPTADRSAIYAAAHDVTEQRAAREQLQAQAESLAEAHRIARLGNWSWDVASNTVHWSEHMYRVFGIDPAQFTPTYAGFLALVHPDDRARVEALVGRSLTEKVSMNFEHRTVLADGSVRHIQAHNRLVLDQAGNPAKLVGTAQDITERSRAQDALRVSEERFRIVSQATNDAIWDWDLDAGVVTYNRAFDANFGPGTSEPTLRTARPLENVHPGDRERVKASIEAFLAGRQDAWTSEYRLLLTDGSYAHVLDRAVVQRDAAGKATRMVGSMMNVSGQKQQEEVLRQAMAAAEEANRAKSDFLANMSHEIRTPMNGVLGTLGLLMDSPLSAAQRELAGLARSSGESLLNLINDILDFSKIEAGKLSLEPIPFDLLRAAEDVTDMMAALAAGKNLDLIVRYAPDVPRHVVGDPGRIRQVLTNLLSNAIKFTDAGQVLLDIEAQTQDAHSVLLCIRVEDTGIGISEEQLAHVFDKFTQADASTTRRHGGTGLGLAISTQLVEMMGGTMGARSQPGKGSTFWFSVRLPRQLDAPALPLPPADLAGVRVLIVDDNAVNRRVLHEQVIGWKMRSGSCASAAEALQLLREAHAAGDPYGIAILDYQMPDIDGEMLGRQIKSDAALRDIVLVMLTSLGQRGDVSRLKALGFAAYLVKPARQSELLAALGSVWAARLRGEAASMVTRHTLQEGRVTRLDQARLGTFDARVLLAEDHPTNQLVASMMLRNLGCQVDIAGNGREAVAMAAAAAYDVVFMDCEMPVMDGFAATAAIRGRSDGGSRVPIVAVTAQAMQGDRERCLRAGMDDYVSKPVQAADFAAALARWAPARRVAKAMAPAADGAAVAGDERVLPDDAVLDAEVISRLRTLAEATEASLLQQVFDSFRRDGAMRLASLEQAARSGDADTLRQAAHALKGASGNIGARRLVALAQELETLAEDGTAAAAPPLVARMQAEFAEVVAALDALATGEVAAAGPPP